MTFKPKLKKSVLLSLYSTFKIGGPARLFFEMKSQEDAMNIMKYIFDHKIPYLVIGKGSNVLFDDQGFDGLVILNKLQSISFEDQFVKAEAGFSFALLGVKTALNGFKGLEFASGIPGSVGGAIYMNAGANGQETKDSLVEVGFVTESGDFKVFTKPDLIYGYRSSIFQNLKGIIIYGLFELEKDSSARKHQKEIVKYRMQSQPYKQASIGCIFRNPESKSAGKLIEESGLKGFCENGAMVSKVHANFIVNTGTASSKDVLNLIEKIKKKVKEKKGVELQEEIRYIPSVEMES